MKKIFIMLIVIIMLFGCGVESDDSCGSTVPTITKVSFHDCYDCDGNECVDYENTMFEFNIGDEFDIIIEATDCNLDMKYLVITIYCEDDWTTPCDLLYYDLPKQMDTERGYHFDPCFIMDYPVGSKIYEFQIEDGDGHISNILPVTIKVE